MTLNYPTRSPCFYLNLGELYFPLCALTEPDYIQNQPLITVILESDEKPIENQHS